MGDVMKMLSAIAVIGALPGLIFVLAYRKGPDDRGKQVALAKEERLKKEEKAERCAPFESLYKNLIGEGLLVDRPNDINSDIYINSLYWQPLNIDAREGLVTNLYYCHGRRRILDHRNGRVLAERGIFSGWEFN